MRIVFIGDLQYATAAEERLSFKMKQLRTLSPDFACVMGDIGGSHMKSVQGFTEARDHVEMLGCPYEVILGNHDVEYGIDDPNYFRYEKVFADVFHGKKRFNSFVRDGVLYILVSCERRPEEDFRTHNAVYVSDGQFETVKSALAAHPGLPAVLVTHAPLPGSGLRRWMPLHCGACDTYLDQSFKAQRWRDLIRDHPQIRLSVSAHFHMSHEYTSALTCTGSVTHVSCGVMTICARDDIFQTRVCDINENGATVYTFSHTSGELRFDAYVDFTGKSRPYGNLSYPREGEMQLGDDRVNNVWELPEYGRYYVATGKGCLWEYQSELAEFNGAITLSGGADALSSYDGRLYVRDFDGAVYSVELESTGRFDRIDAYIPRESRPEPEMRGDPLPVNRFGERGSKEGNYVIIDLKR